MPEATYTEMLLRWKILLYLLENVKVDPEEEVDPQTSEASTSERSESCREQGLPIRPRNGSTCW
jgi:hypothetical protein